MKLAYSPTEIPEHAPVSKSRVYEALNDGVLKAHKNGSRTVILHDDLMAYLRSLPDYEPQAHAA